MDGNPRGPSGQWHLGEPTSKEGPKNMTNVERCAGKTKVTVNVCPTCDREFGRLYNLKVHMRKHSGEMPYECPMANCKDRFKWRSSMAHHVRAHHKGTSADILRSSAQRRNNALAGGGSRQGPGSKRTPGPEPDSGVGNSVKSPSPTLSNTPRGQPRWASRQNGRKRAAGKKRNNAEIHVAPDGKTTSSQDQCLLQLVKTIPNQKGRKRYKLDRTITNVDNCDGRWRVTTGSNMGEDRLFEKGQEVVNCEITPTPPAQEMLKSLIDKSFRTEFEEVNKKPVVLDCTQARPALVSMDSRAEENAETRASSFAGSDACGHESKGMRQTHGYVAGPHVKGTGVVESCGDGGEIESVADEEEWVASLFAEPEEGGRSDLTLPNGSGSSGGGGSDGSLHAEDIGKSLDSVMSAMAGRSDVTTAGGLGMEGDWEELFSPLVSVVGDTPIFTDHGFLAPAEAFELL